MTISQPFGSFFLRVKPDLRSDLRNNIFANTQTAGNTRYAIYSGAANTVFSNIDYNNYYTLGAALGFIGSARTTLADIQTGFGGNINSKALHRHRTESGKNRSPAGRP